VDNSAAFGPGPTGAAGDFGATQGGIQDMSFARETVEAGRVPPPEAFTAEAMFSEHDLPIEGEACTRLLCLRAASGRAADRTGEPSAWVQVGMSSTVAPETYERPSLSIIAVVDVSGSMGWQYGGDHTPGALSKGLLTEIAAQLGEADRFSIVTYGSTSRVLLDPIAGSENDRILDAVESLSEGGSTNMEAGLRLGYEVASGEAGRAEQVRVMLFTDVQPNVGLTTASEFERLTQEASDEGVGLTVFALGLGLNPDVLRGMSQIRDANAFSLTEPEHVPELMEDSWPWMVSPIAYDLELMAVASPGFVVADGYGFPESTTAEASLSVSTVFLSRRRGALLLRFASEGDAPLERLSVELSLEYRTLDGELVTESFRKELSSLVEDETFEQSGVGKTVLLARLVAGMKEAAELYASDRDSAIAVLEGTHAQFEVALEAVDDAALEAERAFSARLLALMREGASQESLYGGF
jgi:Ca-activated chloride channel family protein